MYVVAVTDCGVHYTDNDTFVSFASYKKVAKLISCIKLLLTSGENVPNNR